MKAVEFSTQGGNLGQSFLITPTESSSNPQKLSSLDGSLIDHKMGAAPRVISKKVELSTASEHNDIQVMNRFNDHQLNNNSSL
jgi:hypothetical protein